MPQTHLEFTPIPESVWNHVPRQIRDVGEYLEKRTDRDLWLTGALPVLAGMMPDVLLKYGKQWQALNLYTCVIAPSGAGKGILRVPKRLGDVLHHKLFDDSIQRLAEYEQEKQNIVIKEGEEAAGTIDKPKFRRFFIAEDNSASAIKEALWHVPHGVIFATEARSLAQSLTSDWGNYRDVLLKSYHNESIQVERKYQTPMLIRRPAISMMISGTPGSFEGVLTDTEDGLFSRMMFYFFDDEEMRFENQFESDEEVEMDVLIDRLAMDLPALYEILSIREEPLYVYLENHDQQRVVQAGHRAMEIVLQSGDVNLSASVKRAALNAFRIAGLFTVFDRYIAGDNFGTDEGVACKPEYVTAGLTLAFSYLEHAVRLSEAMYEGVEGIATARMKFYRMLPDGEFGSSEVKGLVAELGISKSTAYRYLEWFESKGHIKRIIQGTYKKTPIKHDYSVLRDLGKQAIKPDDEKK